MVRLKDIAEDVGISISAVSQVLRNKAGKVKVSESTKSKIFEAVKRLDYEPQAAARSLVTGKTYNIGFLVSSKTTLALGNHYYSMVLSGVQHVAEMRGYNCIVSAYDLSSIDNFVMPAKFRRRNIDGVVVTGYVKEVVAEKLLNYGLPIVMVGENTDFSTDRLLAAGTDPQGRFKTVLDYLFNLGHRRMVFGTVYTERQRIALNQVLEQFGSAIDCGICSRMPDDGIDEFEFGEKAAKKWMQSLNRPTAIFGNSQFCVGILGYFLEHGIKCPDDVTVISNCDDVLCQRFAPKISALAQPAYENTQIATGVLIDYIEKKIDWAQAHSLVLKSWRDGEIIVRATCSAPSS